MAGPSDRGGIRLTVPEGSDVVRDMHALIRAILHGDSEGQDAILAHADLPNLACCLASALAGCLIAVAADGQADLDVPACAPTSEQLIAAEAILFAAVDGPGDDLDDMGP